VDDNTQRAAVFPLPDVCRRHPDGPSVGYGDGVGVRNLSGLAWTRWDTRQVGRAALAAAVMLGLAWLVTAATDEGGVAWGEPGERCR
jgi:hypothetical protein